MFTPLTSNYRSTLQKVESIEASMDDVQKQMAWIVEALRGHGMSGTSELPVPKSNAKSGLGMLMI